MENKMEISFAEASLASKEYFNGDELAASVFVGKYALRDNLSNLLERTPDDMHRRLAKEFARVESRYPAAMSEDEIYELFKGFKKIIPQGSPMSAIGNNYKLQSASNCFVINPPNDSYAGILFTDQQEAQIMKRRGGVGFDISTIRPKGLATQNAAGTTDGIGIFMERFSNTCREVAQGGRRGALMLSISCHHPEIRTFINIKKDLTKVTGANISIRWTDEFMEAVEESKMVQLRFPTEKDVPHSVEQMVDAKEIWDEFIQAAHASAEPGCLFWDTAIKYTPADIYAEEGFASSSTNPCGEILLSPGDSCRLITMNTLSYVLDPFTNVARFAFKEFKLDVIKAQRLMDDLVELEIELVDKIIAKIKSDPEPEHVKQIELDLWLAVRHAAVTGRRTGLGVTAIGDTLAALNIKYGSEESIAMTEQIYKALAMGAYTSSVQLAKERGAFPIFSHDKENGHPFLQRIWDADPELYSEYYKYGRRNIALTTTAPTGSVSTLTQTSSGIEPVFMTHYKRRKKINPNDANARVDFVDALGDKWQEYIVWHHGVEQWMKISGESDVTKSPYYEATANEINWEAAVDLQAAAQKWICHAISKTTNLPNSATISDIDKLYRRGWKTQCKGITVYRDGCRSGVLVSAEEKPSSNAGGRPSQIQHSHAPRRPDALPCDIHHVTVKGVRWVILMGLMEGQPYEMFAGAAENLILPSKLKSGLIQKVKHGVYSLRVQDSDGGEFIIKNIVNTFDNPESAWATRMISMSLRHGVDVSFIVDQLSKDGMITDINKVLSRVLKKYILEDTLAVQKCKDCKSKNVVFAEGCLTCKDCGSSKCG
jgi:ribonucleoside-diphosphate reductase alpha chain